LEIIEKGGGEMGELLFVFALAAILFLITFGAYDDLIARYIEIRDMRRKKG
jgi:hypothetical protein